MFIQLFYYRSSGFPTARVAINEDSTLIRSTKENCRKRQLVSDGDDEAGQPTEMLWQTSDCEPAINLTRKRCRKRNIISDSEDEPGQQLYNCTVIHRFVNRYILQ